MGGGVFCVTKLGIEANDKGKSVSEIKTLARQSSTHLLRILKNHYNKWCTCD